MKQPSSAPIARGRTAEIYFWDDAHVLKLYFDWCPSHWIEEESRIASAIHGAGIPTPAAGEIVEVQGRRGLIYERVEGPSMLQEMNSRPWTLFRHARSLAELQARIHQLSIASLPSYKHGLGHAINSAQGLDENLRNKTLHLLDSLPDDQKLCHGDYHPGNILITRNGPVVIDWMTACSGCHWADVARTSLLLTIGPRGAPDQVSPLVRIAIQTYHRMDLNRYLDILPDKTNELERWTPVLAAARLNENIIPERDALLEIVKKVESDESFTR